MNWNPERVLVYRKSREALRAHHLEAIPTPAAATGAVRRQRIGIWDLNASAGSLPHLLDAIEDAQGYFSFYCVEAAFQTALTTPGEHVAAQWKRRIGDRMSPTAAEANVCASPIFEAARPVLTALPLDWLVVVVRSMIADESDPDDAWYNLFATSRGHVVLLSTADMREYAAEAGRPFESAVVGTALSIVVQEMVPALDRTPGSIFDFCENRHDIVNVIRTPKIDTANRARIPAEILEPTERVLDILTRYKGSTTAAQMRRQRKILATARPQAPMKKIGVPSAVVFQDLLKTLNASLPTSEVKTKQPARKRAIAKSKTAKKKAATRGR